MCGFVGFIDEGSGYDRRAVIAAMAEAIAHRGPDSDGFFDDGRCALGFRRLAIIDLEGAQQPLVNEDGTLVLVFNGEIYNYRELRDQLRAAGHRFSTQGDGEVVLHGFEQWGDSLLAHLRGMFAFALYNRRTGEVFCARDAFGIKPLYYQDQGARLLFASEIKGLLPHPRFAKELHAERLTTYLCMEYQPDDATLFKGVRKLPAGHWMRWRQGKCQVQRWFWPRYAPDGATSLEENAARIDDALRDSVRAHAVADVEVGCFLSAGVDSSLVAHKASQIMDARTFSIGYGEERFSELAAAKDFARTVGLRNRQSILDAAPFFDSVGAVQYALDEPLPNPSAIPLYHLCSLAAEDVKVVMSGEGADELFGGYPYYQECLAYEPYEAVPAPLRRALGRAAAHLPAGTHGRRFLMRGAQPFSRRYLRWEYNFTFEEACDLLQPDLLASLSASGSTAPELRTNGNEQTPPHPHRTTLSRPHCPIPPWALGCDLIEIAQNGEIDEVTAMQTLDLLTWLQQDILLKADKLSMAASLELRVPFLDRTVWAAARALPTQQRVARHETKVALRRAATRTLPSRTATMPKKGFLTPLAQWLREEPWAGMVREELNSETARQHFRIDRLNALLDEHQSGTRSHMKKIWSVYCFLIWHRQFFE